MQFANDMVNSGQATIKAQAARIEELEAALSANHSELMTLKWYTTEISKFVAPLIQKYSMAQVLKDRRLLAVHSLLVDEE